MLSWAAPMNWRSVAEHVCTTAARPLPPSRSTNDPAKKIANARPAAAVRRGFTHLLSAPLRAGLYHPFGWRGAQWRAEYPASTCAAQRHNQTSSASPTTRLTGSVEKTALEDQRPIGAVPAHPDRLVDANGRCILRTDKEAHRRHPLEQEATQVAHPPLRVAPVPDGRIDPHLLDLDRRRSPRGCLRLEEDRVSFDPEPRAPFLDLRPRAPAKPLRVSGHRVDADLLLVRGSAGWYEQVEVGFGRSSESALTRRRRVGDRVNGLQRALVPRARHSLGEVATELGYRPLVADDHLGAPARGDAGKAPTVGTGRDDVRADVAKRGQASVFGECCKTP